MAETAASRLDSEMLPTVERMGAAGEVRKQDVALLVDRVLTHTGHPQRYGSQFDVVNGRLVAPPIADLAHVDSLRATMGLRSMSEYVRVLGEFYKIPAAWPPAP